MDAQVFSSILRKPFLLKDYSSEELLQLSEKYPYASAIHSLIALKAHQENDGSYEHYLHQAAIRVPDRKRLYHLIHSETNEDEMTILENVQFAKPESKVIESNKTIIPPLDIELPDAESLIKVSMPDEQEKPVIKRKEETELAKEADEKQSLELPGADEAIEALKLIRDEKNLREPKVEEKAEEIKRVKLPQSHEHSFTEWLSFLKQSQSLKKESPVLKEIQESDAKEEIEFTQNTKLSEKDEATLAQKAKASLSDDMEWVTETLAKIYELQKKYDKAEEAYKMLSLKYPDKKAYFVQRIENLKKFRV